jgi:hypothetical protein
MIAVFVAGLLVAGLFLALAVSSELNGGGDGAP